MLTQTWPKVVQPGPGQFPTPKLRQLEPDKSRAARLKLRAFGNAGGEAWLEGRKARVPTKVWKNVWNFMFTTKNDFSVFQGGIEFSKSYYIDRFGGLSGLYISITVSAHLPSQKFFPFELIMNFGTPHTASSVA